MGLGGLDVNNNNTIVFCLYLGDWVCIKQVCEGVRKHIRKELNEDWLWPIYISFIDCGSELVAYPFGLANLFSN